jgi:hypothetical protein
MRRIAPAGAVALSCAQTENVITSVIINTANNDFQPLRVLMAPAFCILVAPALTLPASFVVRLVEHAA